MVPSGPLLCRATPWYPAVAVARSSGEGKDPGPQVLDSGTLPPGLHLRASSASDPLEVGTTELMPVTAVRPTAGSLWYRARMMGAEAGPSAIADLVVPTSAAAVEFVALCVRAAAVGAAAVGAVVRLACVGAQSACPGSLFLVGRRAAMPAVARGHVRPPLPQAESSQRRHAKVVPHWYPLVPDAPHPGLASVAEWLG